MPSINPVAQFKAFVKRDVKQRAQVISVDSSTGRCQVELTGGGFQWVSGNAPINEFVMISGGIIVAKLPSLPFNRVEV